MSNMQAARNIVPLGTVFLSYHILDNREDSMNDGHHSILPTQVHNNSKRDILRTQSMNSNRCFQLDNRSTSYILLDSEWVMEEGLEYFSSGKMASC